MSHSAKLNDEQQKDAAETGIAFGWEIGSILMGKGVCLAACEICEGLSARIEMRMMATDPMIAEAVKLDQEGKVWSAFRAQALLACCDHLLDYLAAKGAFVLPTERAANYRDELLTEEDREACDATGIAFGLAEDQGFIAGCDRCAYVMRVSTRDVIADHGVAAHIMTTRMAAAAYSKTCAHFFRWLETREEGSK